MLNKTPCGYVCDASPLLARRRNRRASLALLRTAVTFAAKIYVHIPYQSHYIPYCSTIVVPSVPYSVWFSRGFFRSSSLSVDDESAPFDGADLTDVFSILSAGEAPAKGEASVSVSSIEIVSPVL